MSQEHLVKFIGLDKSDGDSELAVYCNNCKRTFPAKSGHEFLIDSPCVSAEEEDEAEETEQGETEVEAKVKTKASPKRKPRPKKKAKAEKPELEILCD